MDNEPIAVKILKSYIDDLDYLEIVGTCNNAFRAIDILNNENIDLMFLDVNMPGLPGTQMLKTIQWPPKVIFTTANKDYAIEAFELDAIDYLLKPVSFERFLKAVNKFCQSYKTDSVQHNSEPGFLYFRTDRKMVKVFLKDITYIESFKDYIIIHRQNENELKVKYPISSVENMLPQSLFLRIHRSYIVSIKKVTAFSNHDVEIGKIELPVGKSYPDVFKKLTGNNSILPNPGLKPGYLPFHV
ncbi:LytR/AlgR family response regulator transcription factor [Mariniphaga sp.]|uniref:LytR/AlgR family response regulator transcription factor n=1 Tax=Mariniphaga sp. TaxID=1954475 RepID=UPI0035691D29